MEGSLYIAQPVGRAEDRCGSHSNNSTPQRRETMTTAMIDSARPFPPTPPFNSNESVGTSTEQSKVTGSRRGRNTAAPNEIASFKRLEVPRTSITPPISISPPQPQYLHSRQNSSVAESFQTARESPWLSEDGASAAGDYVDHWEKSKDLDADLGLGFEAEGDASRRAPTALSQNTPDPEWDPELMRNITIRPKRKSKPYNLVLGGHDSRGTSPQHVASPKTPTGRALNQKYPSPQHRLRHASPSLSEGTNRRISSISSKSTVIEAIIISTPPKTPPKLRHVSKTPSLRSDVSSTPRVQSMRISSDSANPLLMQSATKRFSLADESRNDALKAEKQPRVVTEPLLRHQRDSGSLHADLQATAARSRGSYSVRLPINDPSLAYDVFTSPSSYIPLSALPAHTRKLSMSNSLISRSHARSESYSSGKTRSSLSSQSDSFATRSATYRALENTVNSSSVPLPSSTTDSLVTVLGQPAAHRKLNVANDANLSLNKERSQSHSRTFSSPISFLIPPSNDRRPSDDSGRSIEQSENGTRISLDRTTMLSEDHPRQIYSQSTPFSQMSDTPLEVSEATAIRIHPHNNRSVLMVEQARYPSQVANFDETTSDELLDEPPRIAFQPSTPPSKSNEMLIDSPLRNPRTAPIPPTIMVLPATPMRDEDDPLAAAAVNTLSVKHGRPSVLQRARRYSDSLIQPFFRSNSFGRRRHYSQPIRARQRDEKDRHLHPFWHPREFWMNTSESDSEWDDDDDDVEPLPPGGDTSEPPPSRLPRSLSRRLPGFRGNGGFLIGNSLNLERHGTNKRRHHVEPPAHFSNSQISLRRDSADHPQSSTNDGTLLETPAQLRMKQSLGSLRSVEMQRRLRRRRWRILGVSVEYVGVDGIKERWQQSKQRRESRKAEERREEIRRSIGPRILVENWLPGAAVDVPLK